MDNVETIRKLIKNRLDEVWGNVYWDVKIDVEHFDWRITATAMFEHEGVTYRKKASYGFNTIEDDVEDAIFIADYLGSYLDRWRRKVYEKSL